MSLFQSFGRDSVGFSRGDRASPHQRIPEFQSLGRDSVGFSLSNDHPFKTSERVVSIPRSGFCGV